MQKTQLRGQSFWLWIVPFLFLLIFFFYPLGSIFSLAVGSGLQKIAIIPWERIGNILGFTIFQAALSTLLTLLVGLPAAFIFGRYIFKGKDLLRVLTTLPFILPTVVVAAGFNALIGPRGWLNLAGMWLFNLNQPPIQILNTLGAILLAHVFYNTAVVIRVVGVALERLDPRLEQVSRTMGASPWRNFWQVVFPLIRPALASAALVVFLFDFTSFGVILLLGGPQYATLEVEIYYQTMQLLNLPLAALLSAIQIACTLLLTFFIIRGGGGAVLPVRPQVQQEGMRPAKGWIEKILIFLIISILILLLVLPLAALALRSVVRLEASRGEREFVLPGLTGEYYRELFINRRQSLFYVPPILALRNSLLYATVASLIALIMGFMAASTLTSRKPWMAVLDPILMLPIGTSAVTLGLGFIVAFARQPNARELFPILIPIAHSLVALPFVVRVLQPALGSIPASLPQSAAVLGASPFQVWRRVQLPIAARAAAVAGLFAFTISLGEFGATAFLSRPDIPTLPVAIFRFLSLPGALNYGQALAMATMLMCLCAAVMIIIDKINLNPNTK